MTIHFIWAFHPEVFISGVAKSFLQNLDVSCKVLCDIFHDEKCRIWKKKKKKKVGIANLVKSYECFVRSLATISEGEIYSLSLSLHLWRLYNWNAHIGDISPSVYSECPDVREVRLIDDSRRPSRQAGPPFCTAAATIPIITLLALPNSAPRTSAFKGEKKEIRKTLAIGIFQNCKCRQLLQSWR